MSNYRRTYVPGGTFFYTLVCKDRQPIFNNAMARKHLRNAIVDELKRAPFDLVAMVLLHDHLHTIWTMPDGDSAYPMRWRKIKESFTRRYLGSGGSEATVSEAQRLRNQRGVWQLRYWEHTVRDEADFSRCLDYIHWNPVKHGYVNRPCDYPWSTFRKFVGLGVYDPLWGTGKVFEDVPGAEWD